MSCVFRHFSQYKYNTMIPKQPTHLLPKRGHDSATYFTTHIFHVKNQHINNLNQIYKL